MAESPSVELLERLKDFPRPSMEASIFRVPENIRSTNPKDFEPQKVAIGPLHRHKHCLRQLENVKLLYLEQILELHTHLSVKKMTDEMKKIEKEVRKCYWEQIDLNSAKFVEMLVLDGCFILHFLRKYEQNELEDDPVFRITNNETLVLFDLLLFENQIPFIVLKLLFKMIYKGHGRINLLLVPLLGNPVFNVSLSSQELDDFTGPHLVGMVHSGQCKSFAQKLRNINLVDDVDYIPSAVELNNAGIKFVKLEAGRLFEIEFTNNSIIIPKFTMTEDTGSLIRNLIAYEQYLPGTEGKYVTDYAFFMHRLILSDDDAVLLRRGEIIDSLLGSDTRICEFMQRLTMGVTISTTYSYANICFAMNRHLRNTWVAATLRRDYFNNPWSLISFVAAIALLLLTITLAVFSILSYRHDLDS